MQCMREWRSGNVGAFQAHVESSILSSRTNSLSVLLGLIDDAPVAGLAASGTWCILFVCKPSASTHAGMIRQTTSPLLSTPRSNCLCARTKPIHITPQRGTILANRTHHVGGLAMDCGSHGTIVAWSMLGSTATTCTKQTSLGLRRLVTARARAVIRSCVACGYSRYRRS